MYSFNVKLGKLRKKINYNLAMFFWRKITRYVWYVKQGIRICCLCLVTIAQFVSNVEMA